jgi:N-acetylglucosaminyl-diphospho-decaprenol L-rhamnosyltransferase
VYLCCLRKTKQVAGRVWIVIVNYRTADLAVDCLHSIAAQIGELPKLHTVVVDNASGDGSVEKLMGVMNREGWHRWASLLPLDRNGGFAFGNNAGIREALRSTCHVAYVMLLNPDTIVHGGAIRALVDFMDAHQRVGIAGSRLESAEGAAECSAHTAFSPLGELESGARLGVLSRALHRYAVTPPMRETAHECDWVSGASLIIRREVVEEIGLLDEGYFLYFEEVDFCIRARKAGWKTWFVPESRVVHLEGASTGIRNIVRRRPQYWYDSRRRYFVKHFGMLGLILADALWAAGRTSLVLRRMLRLGSGGNLQDPKWFALDLLWGDLRSFFPQKNDRR